MPKTTPADTKQQKLAQKLRENLKRRKEQKRQRNIGQSTSEAGKTQKNPKSVI